MSEASLNNSACFETNELFDRWRQLVVQYQITGKTAHDARLVAAMDRHSVKQLLSFNDRHFQQFPHISVFHPDNIESLPPA
jgi:predicted nucleic acid-binding protein